MEFYYFISANPRARLSSFQGESHQRSNLKRIEIGKLFKMRRCRSCQQWRRNYWSNWDAASIGKLEKLSRHLSGGKFFCLTKLNQQNFIMNSDCHKISRHIPTLRTRVIYDGISLNIILWRKHEMKMNGRWGKCRICWYDTISTPLDILDIFPNF